MSTPQPPSAPGPIRREVLIDASLEEVWDLVSEPQHLVRWFSDEVDMDRRVGGSVRFTWHGHGSFPGRIERLQPPHVFAFSWLRTDDAAPGEVSTLVEISLETTEAGTRVRVVESGFSDLPWSDERRLGYRSDNELGWARELAELVEHVRRAGRSTTTAPE